MLLLARLLSIQEDIKLKYQEYLTADRNLNFDLSQLDQQQYKISVLREKTPIGHDNLEKAHQAVIDSINQYCKNIDQLIQFVQDEVRREHQQYCQTVTDLLDNFTREIDKQSAIMLDRQISLNFKEYVINPSGLVKHCEKSDLNDFIKLQVFKYVDWRYPGLLFRPLGSNCVDYMVGFDPLYLVDIDEEYLNPVVTNFNEAYQRRLRKYVIDDREEQPILDKLPQGQFGCVVAHNYFDIKSYKTVCRYLTEVFDLLKPGGVFVFTFNDCDYIKAIELVESFDKSYVPGHKIKETATTIGYQIIHHETVNDQLTCIELQKPGELSSIRGGQTLARIMPN